MYKFISGRPYSPSHLSVVCRKNRYNDDVNEDLEQSDVDESGKVLDGIVRVERLLCCRGEGRVRRLVIRCASRRGDGCQPVYGGLRIYDCCERAP